MHIVVGLEFSYFVRMYRPKLKKNPSDYNRQRVYDKQIIDIHIIRKMAYCLVHKLKRQNQDETAQSFQIEVFE